MIKIIKTQKPYPSNHSRCSLETGRLMRRITVSNILSLPTWSTMASARCSPFSGRYPVLKNSLSPLEGLRSVNQICACHPGMKCVVAAHGPIRFCGNWNSMQKMLLIVDEEYRNRTFVYFANVHADDIYIDRVSTKVFDWESFS